MTPESKLFVTIFHPQPTLPQNFASAHSTAIENGRTHAQGRNLNSVMMGWAGDPSFFPVGGTVARDHAASPTELIVGLSHFHCHYQKHLLATYLQDLLYKMS